MTSGIADTLEHPLASLVAEVSGSLHRHRAAPAWTVRPAELPGLLNDLVAAENALASVRLKLLREADRHKLGEASGHTNTANWWAEQSLKTRPAAHQELKLAASLDDSAHEPAAFALESGEASVEQVAVIVRNVDKLPADLVGATVRREVETLLVGYAKHHDPKELRILGRHALEVIAPDVAEEIERRRLENEEQHAAATATFTMSHDGEGSMCGRFKIPVLAGEILAKHLAAIAAPRHQHAKTDGPLAPAVSRPMRLGNAFVEYLETRETPGTPKAGGLAATVVVTMTLADLLGGDQAATLDSGEAISASEARRLACEAGIIPAVLGSPSQVLDLGRKTRFHTEPQRIAIALRDKGCRAEYCDWPPGMSHIHHPTPWARGGTTSVENGVMLCPKHHTLAHDARYQMKAGPNGKVTFSRRT